MADTDQKLESQPTKLEREQLDEAAADPTKPLPDDLIPPLIYAWNEGTRIRRTEEKLKVREQGHMVQQEGEPDPADPNVPLSPELVPAPEPTIKIVLPSDRDED